MMRWTACWAKEVTCKAYTHQHYIYTKFKNWRNWPMRSQNGNYASRGGRQCREGPSGVLLLDLCASSVRISLCSRPCELTSIQMSLWKKKKDEWNTPGEEWAVKVDFWWCLAHRCLLNCTFQRRTVKGVTLWPGTRPDGCLQAEKLATLTTDLTGRWGFQQLWRGSGMHLLDHWI